MKKLIFLFVILVALVYFYPAKQGSTFYNFQSRVKSMGKSKADYSEELYYKKQELKAYEKAIVDITNQFENVVENGPTCPITGNKAITTITKDPRDELEDKCERLRKEILELEAKI